MVEKVSVLICICFILCSVDCRPVFKDYYGTLRKASLGEKVHQASITNTDISGRHFKINYWAEPSATTTVHLLDAEPSLEEVVCHSSGKMVLSFNTTTEAKNFFNQIHAGDTLTGGREWGCANPQGLPSILLKRIMSVFLDGRRLVVLARDSSYTQVFRKAAISFSGSKRPPSRVVTHSGTTLVNHGEKLNRSHAKRGLLDWLSDIWQQISSFASEVATIIADLVQTIQALASGDYQYDGTVLGEEWNFNYDASNQGAQYTYELGAMTNCSNCYALLDFDVNFGIDIENYQLNLLSFNISGDFTMHLETTFSVDQPYSDTQEWKIATYTLGDVSFYVGGVPIVLSTSIPVYIGYNFNAEVSCSAIAYSNAFSAVTYGFIYTPNTGYLPINEHNFTAHGSVLDITEDITATLQIYIKPVIYCFIDYIGDVHFGFRSFLEFTFDADPDNPCAPNYQTSLNWGLHMTEGSDINIVDIFQYSWGPTTLYSVKKPIQSGCVVINDADKTFSIENGPIIAGNNWAGWQKQVVDSCQGGAVVYPPGDQTVQAIKVKTDGDVISIYAVEAATYTIPEDGTWCLVQGSTNIQLSLTDLTYEVTPVQDDNSYVKCANSAYESSFQSVPGTGRVSADLNVWTTSSADGCSETRVGRVGESDQNVSK